MGILASRLAARVVLSALAIGVVSTPARAERWGFNSGPGDGPTRMVVAQPGNANVLFAVGSGAGVFRSLDGGQHWQSLGPAVGYGLVRRRAFSVGSDGSVYLGTDRSELFVSRDLGETWQLLPVHPPSSDRLRGRINLLLVAPSNPLRLWLRSDAVLSLVSDDGGSSWWESESAPYVADPRDERIGYTEARVSKTTDGGRTWVPTMNTNTWTEVASVAIDSIEPTRLLAVGGSIVFTSTNAAGSWAETRLELEEDETLRAVAIDPLRSNTAYIGTDRRIFKSTDRGESWLPLAGGLPATSINSILVGPVSSDVVYAATDAGVFRSATGGDTWALIESGMATSQVRRIAVAANPDIAYAATRNGVFKTTDAGRSWRAVVNGLSGSFVTSVAVDARDSSIVFASTDLGVFKSIDGGDHWQMMNNGLRYTFVGAIATAASDPNTLYAGTAADDVPEVEFSSVFHTNDGGRSWAPAQAGLPLGVDVSSLAVDPSNPRVAFVAADEGTFKTSDGGLRWERIEGIWGHAVTIDPSQPSNVYVASDSGRVHRSQNSGLTWDSTLVTQEDLHDVVVDPSDSTVLYGTTGSGGVIKSTDRGATWLAINAGLQHPSARTIAIAPSDHVRIYIGTEANGAYSQICGNGAIDPGEDCDDGNLIDGDQCDSSCIAEETVCTADCDGDAVVSVDEIVTGVSIALGVGDLAHCPAFDESGDGQVTVDELLVAVQNALNGCGSHSPGVN